MLIIIFNFFVIITHIHRLIRIQGVQARIISDLSQTWILALIVGECDVVGFDNFLVTSLFLVSSSVRDLFDLVVLHVAAMLTRLLVLILLLLILISLLSSPIVLLLSTLHILILLVLLGKFFKVSLAVASLILLLLESSEVSTPVSFLESTLSGVLIATSVALFIVLSAMVLLVNLIVEELLLGLVSSKLILIILSLELIDASKIALPKLFKTFLVLLIHFITSFVSLEVASLIATSEVLLIVPIVDVLVALIEVLLVLRHVIVPAISSSVRVLLVGASLLLHLEAVVVVDLLHDLPSLLISFVLSLCEGCIVII